jgi:uncharacterized membrane protein
MKKFLTMAVLVFLFLFAVPKTYAQEPESFYKAEVVTITNQGKTINDAGTFPFQEVTLKILEGDMKDEEITLTHGKNSTLSTSQLVKTGETVVVNKISSPDGTIIFQITDRYRLNTIWPILIFFFVIVILLSQWRGVGSIAGMIISLGVILTFIVPQIVAGANPLLITIIGGLFIMITTIYLAHGFSTQTTIAVVATLLTLIGIGVIASLMVSGSYLSGLGSEDASSLRFGPLSDMDFRGLLLGGIIIGSLGVLDDITTGLTASIFELKKLNPKLNFTQLFGSGLTIGREHVSSLVNTLILAYAGTALPIFLIINLNIGYYPLWLILNDELIIEEVVRTLAGSIGIIAAVPLTTIMASYYLAKESTKK